MKAFLKRYIRPSLRSVGLYGAAYRAYFASLSAISAMLNIFDRMFRKTAPILLYHRIAAVHSDPARLAVTPECFERHLAFLKENYDVVSLYELSQRLTAGTLKGDEAAISFDDGYTDNLMNALPLLERYGLPATIFVTTRFLGQISSFEWDAGYGEADRASVLGPEDIKALSDNPLIEIGAHTESHPRLVDLGAEEQREDILAGKQKLELVTGKKIRLFAYPFGGRYDFDAATERIVRESGFDFAYSNTQRLARASKDRFRIPRMNIRECAVEALAKRLLNAHG